MSFRRMLAALSILCTGLALAEDSAAPPAKIANWAVAPFWSAPLAAPEKSLEESAASPLEADAVPTPPLPLTAIAPCRVADTRGNGFSGQYGPPSLVQGAPRNFALAGQCGIAAGAEAVSLNITVTNTLGPGFILIYPQGGTQPAVSTLNYVAGQTVANAAIVPLGVGGGVTIIAGVSGTDLIIDTNGYFAPQSVVNSVNGLSANVSLAAGSGISITPAGQTLTVASTAPAAWALTGNAGTTAGTNFLGTTDNQALELKVNSARVFRLEPTATAPNVIGGHSANFVVAGVIGATIAGGGNAGQPNRVSDNHGTIGGGYLNLAGDLGGAVDDRPNNTVGGGTNNTANGFSATVGGGSSNTASGVVATVGGGAQNVASGIDSTVPGGNSNTAGGSYSFAAGRRAKALHSGTFVWGDSEAPGADIASTGVDQFIVRASGGLWFGTTDTASIPAGRFLNTSTGAHLTSAGIWTNNSDHATKENVRPIDGGMLLERLASMPVSTWNYVVEGPTVQHIGPMAQDFAVAFGVGNDNRSIGTLDADGVALAAIQALYEIVREKNRKIEDLEIRLSRLESGSK